MRHLIGCIPSCVISHQAHGAACISIALRQPKHGIFALQLFRHCPRAVIAHPLQRCEQCNILAKLKRLACNAALVAVLTQGHLGKRFVQNGFVVNIRRACRRKITVIGEVRAFTVFDFVDQLRNQKVQIRITLTMSMRGHVHGHSVDSGCKVSAMVQVETTQKILIGLAIAGMLRHDHTGDEFQNLTWSQRWATRKQFRPDDAL